MSLINQPATKYKFEGIGEAVAAMVIAALAANPTWAWLAGGFVGKVTWFGAKLLGMGAASLGLVVLNVGAAKIDTIVGEAKFDGSWDSARELIDKIKKENGRELTDEEKKRIDDPVRDAFRRFGRFGRVR